MSDKIAKKAIEPLTIAQGEYVQLLIDRIEELEAERDVFRDQFTTLQCDYKRLQAKVERLREALIEIRGVLKGAYPEFAAVQEKCDE